MYAQCEKDQCTHIMLIQCCILYYDACRSITRCLQPSNIVSSNLCLLAGIAPPALRSSVSAQGDKETILHPLHGDTVPKKRLKSRGSIMHATVKLINSISTRQIELWFKHLQSVSHKLMLVVHPAPGKKGNASTYFVQRLTAANTT